MAWIHNVNVETKSIFSQVQVKLILLVCYTSGQLQEQLLVQIQSDILLWLLFSYKNGY